MDSTQHIALCSCHRPTAVSVPAAATVATDTTINIAVEPSAEWQSVSEHLPLIERAAQQLANKLNVDYDAIYDTAIDTALRCAHVTPFGPYFSRALFNNVVKQLTSSDVVNAITIDHYTVLDSPAEPCVPQSYVEQEQQQLDNELSLKNLLLSAEREIIRATSLEDWRIFLESVIENRAQADIGERYGLGRSAIAMRIKKVRDVCDRIRSRR